MREFDVNSIRDDFPILARQVYGRPLVYLDSAATAQKPRQIVDAMSAMMLGANGNVHRGAHRLSDESTAMYEAARDTVAEFIGAGEREEVIFTSGATASLNVAGHGLCKLLVGEGDNIVISAMEHHSNIVPWQLDLASCAEGASSAGRVQKFRAEIRVLPFDEQGGIEFSTLENLIDDRTRIITITQCSNVLGTRPDIAKISEMAHRRGIVVVVDGCQGVVHGGANVREMGCDVYAFSGHKLYGPTGVGVLWGRREIMDKMPPLLGGGDMVDKVSFEATTWADLPFKFEAGTSNYIGAAGLAEAVKYLRRFDPCDIEKHERKLLSEATSELQKIDGLRIYGAAPDKAPIISFTVEGTHPADIGAILDKQGIAIRTGTHCARPLMARFGVGGMCRASFAIYNTAEECAALADGVRRAVKMLRG